MPLDGTTGRLKRSRLAVDSRIQEQGPSILRPHREGGSSSFGAKPRSPKSAAFRPAWGFRKGDSVLGSTEHCVDWSRHSITPPDWKEVVMGAELERVEAVGCQSIAAVSSIYILPLRSPSIFNSIIFNLKHFVPDQCSLPGRPRAGQGVATSIG